MMLFFVDYILIVVPKGNSLGLHLMGTSLLTLILGSALIG